MTFQRSEAGKVTVLRFEGDIDRQGVDLLRVALLACVKEKRGRVVVNLSGVREVSIMGVGVLVERRRQLRAIGGDIKLVGLSLFVKRVLEMASVNALFSIHDTEAQALEGFREAA
ncbi:MAG: anti-sigma factor antagonist [Nitrospiraceae bacterium]|nr:anti-sigma factor antagonist [Nitrospiraceae bacterium]